VAGIVDANDGYARASPACQARSAAACATASGKPENCVTVSDVAGFGQPVIVAPFMLDDQPADNPAGQLLRHRTVPGCVRYA
jgi:hypothetical protein